MTGIQLDTTGDIKVAGGQLSVGDTLLQDASLVLGLNQGEIKGDPLLGPSLNRYIRSKSSADAIVRQMKIHIERAGIRYDDVKDAITINNTII